MSDLMEELEEYVRKRCDAAIAAWEEAQKAKREALAKLRAHEALKSQQELDKELFHLRRIGVPIMLEAGESLQEVAQTLHISIDQVKRMAGIDMYEFSSGRFQMDKDSLEKLGGTNVQADTGPNKDLGRTMKKMIIRADDLGYSRGVNLGIADALKGGIIQSVGVMTNMPEAESGLEMIRTMDVCLGLHTNICVGRPLTDPALIPSLVEEDGAFKSSRMYRNAPEDFVDLDEVLLEIEAQYQRFVELTGRKPAYVEGHAVASDHFFQGLEIVAQRHGCSYLPFAMDRPVPFKNRQLMLKMGSMDPKYDPTAFLKDLVQQTCDDNDGESGVIPVMVCHPGYLDAFILQTSSMIMPRPLEVEMAQNEGLKDWLEEQNVSLERFDTL